MEAPMGGMTYDSTVAAQAIARLEREVWELRCLAMLAYGALAAQDCEGAAEVCKLMRPALWPEPTNGMCALDIENKTGHSEPDRPAKACREACRG